MALPFAFRLSLYLNLLLASLALGYAELTFLPEITVFALLVSVALGIAFRLEGRWSLSIAAANLAGGIIAAMLGIWFVYQFVRPSGNLMTTLNFPTGLLPYLGPVLMVVMTAKLFRPKDAGDLWAMQGIGLTLIALGCVLAYDMIFAMILFAYVLCGVWSLTLFYLYREQLGSLGDSNRFRMGRFAGLTTAMRWVVGVLGVTLMCFLLTPRSPGGRWDLPMTNRSKMEIGYSANSDVDLGRTGHLDTNEEIVFTVKVTDAAGNPVTNLSADQRWRGRSMHKYEDGKWRNNISDGNLMLIDRVLRAPVGDRSPGRIGGPFNRGLIRNDPNALPELDPQQWTFEFRPETKAPQSDFLADPVMWRTDRTIPVASLIGNRLSSWIQMPDGSMVPLELPNDSVHRYRQVQPASVDPEWGPPLRVDLQTLRYLKQALPGDRMREFTEGILTKLAAQGKLPPEMLQNRNRWNQPLDAEHETIARALTDYLANSGDYRYSLNLDRADRKLDPIEDFLINLRQGHCNRYASGLVMMLRSLGIPARLVLGFRGHQSLGDGLYAVNQSMAHAWVEVLIRRPEVPPTPPRNENRPESTNWYFLSLDPTPSLEADADSNAISRWLGDTQIQGNLFFRDYILGYDSNRQKATSEVIVGRLQTLFQDDAEGGSRSIGWFLALGFAVVAVGVAFGSRFLWGKLHSPPEPSEKPSLASLIPLYGEFLAIAAKCDQEPLPGETPKEFAHRFAAWLAEQSPESEAATFLDELIGRLYAAHYGSLPFDSTELAQWSERLQRFQQQCLAQTAPTMQGNDAS
ncbi:DUF3488 and transglutaminase-like domain-containing protein [Tuwongella immobilis]|uniref:Transglutaminase-like domain-containing protein n=1 Tax=Tuwongella immobilis TaxID=692036 RepID=A0A6C2YNC8_9BACT|nr:transglutaminaseTgpA domain-containing protein [Tuwongella immobilis]VIP02894.1 Uncharacterized protein OS=Candidatus Nitrospira defluvii GN=NIDE0342 PE=4 SV=1: DUF3488: Transglut_core [Tuwongella immobilis]VTS02770.1 Uncharacterized protein OS=Candidatus Nitrospira defluvii GN=NIDE0342 PE=4 SV=1: DUF3488: Transglut_core [Tuwongella immobilis]